MKLLRGRAAKYLLGVILGVTLSIGTANAQAKESYTYLKGVERLIMGDLSGSEKILSGVLKSNPSHTPSLYYLSRIQVAENKIESALENIAKAYKIDSTNTVYGALYAKVLISTKNYDDALHVLNSLRKNDPKDRDNYLYAISILGRQSQSEALLEISREYELTFGGLDEDIVESVYNALLEAQDYSGMLSYLQSVVIREPSNINFCIMLANLYAAFGENDEAVHLYNKAIAENPSSLQAELSLVNYYEIEGDTQQYIKALRAPFQNTDMDMTKKIEIFEKNFFTPEPYWGGGYNDILALATTLALTYPRDEAVILLYGKFLTYVGEVDAALAQYQLLEYRGNISPTLYTRLSEIYLYTKEYDKAIEIALLGQQKYGDEEFYNTEIIARWQKKEYKSAHSLVNSAIKRADSDSTRSALYGLQGDIYHESGDNSKAFKAYKKGLKYNPDNALILNNYGYFLGETGTKLELALEMTTRANELSPNNPTYLDSQAWVLYMMGKNVEAQLIMHKVMALDEDPSGEVLMHYGDILYALGDDFLARNYWKRALEAGASAEDIEKRVLQEKATRSNED